VDNFAAEEFWVQDIKAGDHIGMSKSAFSRKYFLWFSSQFRTGQSDEKYNSAGIIEESTKSLMKGLTEDIDGRISTENNRVAIAGFDYEFLC
jgi:hypothetical protein